MRPVLRRFVPRRLASAIFLAVPVLYRTDLVHYEAQISGSDLTELLGQLECVIALDGLVIECGSATCGTSILMALYLRSRGAGKLVYAYDSYQGFDRRELRAEHSKGLTAFSDKTFASFSYTYVLRKLKVLHMQDIVRPVRGFFKDTLPTIDSTISFAFIDCDLEESMNFCAATIWSHLAPRGRIVFDDYTHRQWGGARRAVDSFVESRRDEIRAHGLLGRLYYVERR